MPANSGFLGSPLGAPGLGRAGVGGCRSSGASNIFRPGLGLSAGRTLDWRGVYIETSAAGIRAVINECTIIHGYCSVGAIPHTEPRRERAALLASEQTALDEVVHARHNLNRVTQMNTAKIFFPTRLRLVFGLPVALWMAGCATTPPAPTAALQAAQQAIVSAEQVDAGHYASGELGEARSKLAAAHSAVANRKMVEALRLAEQSTAEAELALAKTSAAKATAVNLDLSQGNSTLVEEMDRNAGDKQ